jgi:flagellar assembly factor FliW
MEIKGTRFGTISFDADRIITLPRGIIGFAEETQFVFLEPPRGRTVAWLQSVTSPDLAFPVVAGASFGSDYPQPNAAELGRRAKLGTTDSGPESFTTLVIVASRGRPAQRIANLLAPIVVNVDTRVGAQIVLDPNHYSAATPFDLEAATIPAPAPPHPQSHASQSGDATL